MSCIPAFRPLALIAATTIVATLAAAPAIANQRRSGGKLLLTNGVSSIEGAAGGGLATWAVIAGNETEDGNGGTVHATYVALPDFDLSSAGAAIGLSDRVELSYAYQRFDTRAAGAALGLGRGFTFGQHVVGAKLRVAGDAVWAQDTPMPQIAVGIQYRIAQRAPVLRAVGAVETKSADVYVAATKLWLAQGIVADATVRFTEANQFGLLGFGGPRQDARTAQFEGSLAKMLTRRLVVGAEYRTKPDNLAFAAENDSYDLFAAWALDRHLSVTAAYVDLGAIATVRRQRGLFLSLQGGF